MSTSFSKVPFKSIRWLRIFCQWNHEQSQITTSTTCLILYYSTPYILSRWSDATVVSWNETEALLPWLWSSFLLLVSFMRLFSNPSINVTIAKRRHTFPIRTDGKTPSSRRQRDAMPLGLFLRWYGSSSWLQSEPFQFEPRAEIAIRIMESDSRRRLC